MILIVTEEFDPHADILIEALMGRNIDYIRIHLSDFPENLSVSISNFDESLLVHRDGRTIDLSDVSAVWYRRTESPNINKIKSPNNRVFARRESIAHINCLWAYLSNARWVSDPWSIRRAETKLLQLSVANSVGFTVPETIMTNSAAFLREKEEFLLQQPIYKTHTPLMFQKEGGKMGVVYTHRLEQSDLDDLEKIALCPGIFQGYVEKSFEIRVTIFGQSVFANRIESQNDPNTAIDSRARDWNLPSKDHDEIILPVDVKDKCLKMMSILNLNYCAIDLAFDPNSDYVFFELNPNGQWAWLGTETTVKMCSALIDLLAGV